MSQQRVHYRSRFFFFFGFCFLLFFSFSYFLFIYLLLFLPVRLARRDVTRRRRLPLGRSAVFTAIYRRHTHTHYTHRYVGTLTTAGLGALTPAAAAGHKVRPSALSEILIGVQLVKRRLVFFSPSLSLSFNCSLQQQKGRRRRQQQQRSDATKRNSLLKATCTHTNTSTHTH